MDTIDVGILCVLSLMIGFIIGVIVIIKIFSDD